jgi:hypothetical protein
MRKRSTKQRPGQIGEYWLSKKPGREGHNDTWCRTWFDERARQTRRLSLGTTDFQEASLLLANWVVANARPQKAAANEVLIDTILLNYWNDYAKDLPGRSQFDQTHKLLDLNPAGRKQNKKFRPIVTVSATLAAWLRGDQEPEARYVAYRQKPIKSIKRMWHLTCEAAGLNDKLSPYSIRHGMAREMRKRRVPTEQISLFLGHLPRGSDATTSVYAPYEPEYCAEAVEAIESVMAEIRGYLKRANIDRPNPDAASVAPVIVDIRDGGVGNTKREEIRFLILSGLPHAEVVRRTGTSDGTVSLIRTELRRAIPLYRNSESGLSVPFACRDEKNGDSEIAQPIEIIGGPGRIRTCDQAVMSGRL